MIVTEEFDLMGGEGREIDISSLTSVRTDDWEAAYQN